MERNIKINGIVSLSLIGVAIAALLLTFIDGLQGMGFEFIALDCLALALLNGFNIKKMTENKLAKLGLTIAGFVGAAFLGFGLLLIAAGEVVGFTGALAIFLAYLAKDLIVSFFDETSEAFEDYGLLVCFPVALVVCVLAMAFLSDYALHVALLLVNFFLLCRFVARTDNDEVKFFDYIIMGGMGLANVLVVITFLMKGKVTEDFANVFCLANSLYYIIATVFFIAAYKWFFDFSLFEFLLGGKLPTMILIAVFYGLSYLLIYYWWIALLILAVGVGVLALIGHFGDKFSFGGSRSDSRASSSVSGGSVGTEPTYGGLQNVIDRCREYGGLQYDLEYVSRGRYRITISGDILSSNREKAAQKLARSLAQEGLIYHKSKFVINIIYGIKKVERGAQPFLYALLCA